MNLRYMLAFALLVSCLSCSSRQRASASSPAIENASGVRPAKLRYRCEHHGDHPTWHATLFVSVQPEMAGGKEVWRRGYRFEEINIKRGGKFEGTALIDRDTLATLETDEYHVRARSHFLYQKSRIVGTLDDGDGHTAAVDIPVSGFYETGPWNGLDLWVLSQPLKVGYRTHVNLIDEPEPGKLPRPFAVSVEGVEQVRVPAGEFAAFRVLIEPQDGDATMRTIYHVVANGAPMVVRREFIVNPETTASKKRSIGVEELEAIDR